MIIEWNKCFGPAFDLPTKLCLDASHSLFSCLPVFPFSKLVHTSGWDSYADCITWVILQVAFFSFIISSLFSVSFPSFSFHFSGTRITKIPKNCFFVVGFLLLLFGLFFVCFFVCFLYSRLLPWDCLLSFTWFVSRCKILTNSEMHF